MKYFILTASARTLLTKQLQKSFCLGFVLLISLTVVFSSCAKQAANTDVAESQTLLSTIPEELNTNNYSLNYIFKDNVSKEEQKAVIEEAEKAISEINQIFGLPHVERFDCVFDKKHLRANGENRSEAVYSVKTIYCTKYTSFVHEYIHMLLGLSPQRVYVPDKILTEGTATYFSRIWGEKFGSSYCYLFDGVFEHSSSAVEDEAICKLIESKGLELVERNYFNAFIAEFITVDNYKKVTEDFYNYKIGSLTVEYMITECGGIEKFLTVYFDSIRTTELYSKDIDDLVLDAMAWNKKIYR